MTPILERLFLAALLSSLSMTYLARGGGVFNSEQGGNLGVAVTAVRGSSIPSPPASSMRPEA
jgi:hypothetical protein